MRAFPSVIYHLTLFSLRCWWLESILVISLPRKKKIISINCLENFLDLGISVSTLGNELVVWTCCWKWPDDRIFIELQFYAGISHLTPLHAKNKFNVIHFLSPPPCNVTNEKVLSHFAVRQKWTSIRSLLRFKDTFETHTAVDRLREDYQVLHWIEPYRIYE